MASYAIGDIRRGYAWLAHAIEGGVTEILVLHPHFQRKDTAWNRAHNAWPRTMYITSERELEKIVHQYAGEHMVCYGLNPRLAVLRRADGRLRSAKEEDIAASRNLVIDIDLEGAGTPSRLSALSRFLRVADEYFTSLGIQWPVRALTGRGSHLLFGFQSILVAEYPDVHDRLRAFKNHFVAAVQPDLSRLEARVDSTQDLRRMVRVYGTSKPGVGVVSRFYGQERVEDHALREHLLGLEVHAMPVIERPAISVGDSLPGWFTTMLATDAVLRGLWEGHKESKPAGTDHSVSGYDFSVLYHLVQRGHHDPGALGTILALRPDGITTRYAKGKSYVERTVGRALRSIG